MKKNFDIIPIDYQMKISNIQINNLQIIDDANLIIKYRINKWYSICK